MKHLLTFCLTCFLCFAGWTDSCEARGSNSRYASGHSKRYNKKNRPRFKAKNRYGRYGLGVTKEAPSYEGAHSYVLRLSGSKQLGESQSGGDMHGMAMEKDEQALSLMAGTMVGYGLTKNLSIEFMVMYMFDMGAMDPTLGFSYGKNFTKKSRSVSRLVASIPTSEMSQQMNLTTTIKASTGVLYANTSNLSTFISLKGSVPMYSKPNESGGADHGSMAGMDHSGMDGASHGDTSENEDHSDHSKLDDSSETNNSGGMDHGNMNESDDNQPLGGMDHSEMDHSGMDHSGMDHSGMNLADSHTGMDMNSMFMKRETSRIGGDFGGNFEFRKGWLSRTVTDINLISYDDNSTDWLTTVTVAELSYATAGFMDMGTSTMPMGMAVFTNLNFSDKSKDLKIPTTPTIVAGVAYGGM